MRIFAAMSGGVDSSVVAALLKEQGHDLTGVYLKVWSPELEDVMGGCPWEEDVQAVTAVGRHLGIPTEVWDVSKEYFDNVVEYFFDEYKRGRTPNPDVMCNREMKFGIFLKRALERGADMIATGHYARVQHESPLDSPVGSSVPPLLAGEGGGEVNSGRYTLLAGRDKEKDQSYFLYTLNQYQLSKTLFPIGEYTKKEVREMARKYKLPNAERKDSQGVCFIGKIPVKDFLKTRLPEKRGRLVTTDGKVVGEHEGVQYFTIGQRHGIGYPGGGGPYFVVGKDVATNTLVMAEGEEHPSLFQRELTAHHIHWISGVEPVFPIDCFARIRYRQPLERCAFSPTDADFTQKNAETVPRVSASRPRLSALGVVFNNPQRAVTPGQAIVFYDGEIVLGGGVIV